MSRRRVAYAERGPQPAPEPPVAVWAEPDKPAWTPPGCCPKCGKHIGRGMRGHAVNCDGKID
jgi:hypothetical protein